VAEKGIATGLLWTFCADRRDEPVPVWILWRPRARVHVQQRHGQPLPEADLGAPAGPRLCGAQVNIHIEVPRVEYEKLSDERLGEPSAAVRRRRTRLHCAPTGGSASVGPAEVREYCRLDDVPADAGAPVGVSKSLP
jgi:hypothetical protein